MNKRAMYAPRPMNVTLKPVPDPNAIKRTVHPTAIPADNNGMALALQKAQQQAMPVAPGMPQQPVPQPPVKVPPAPMNQQVTVASPAPGANMMRVAEDLVEQVSRQLHKGAMECSGVQVQPKQADTTLASAAMVAKPMTGSRGTGGSNPASSGSSVVNGSGSAGLGSKTAEMAAMPSSAAGMPMDPAMQAGAAAPVPQTGMAPAAPMDPMQAAQQQAMPQDPSQGGMPADPSQIGGAPPMPPQPAAPPPPDPAQAQAAQQTIGGLLADKNEATTPHDDMQFQMEAMAHDGAPKLMSKAAAQQLRRQLVQRAQLEKVACAPCGCGDPARSHAAEPPKSKWRKKLDRMAERRGVTPESVGTGHEVPDPKVVAELAKTAGMAQLLASAEQAVGALPGQKDYSKAWAAANARQRKRIEQLIQAEGLAAYARQAGLQPVKTAADARDPEIFHYALAKALGQTDAQAAAVRRMVEKTAKPITISITIDGDADTAAPVAKSIVETAQSQAKPAVPSQPHLSGTGDSGLTFRHKADDYDRGPAAWANSGKYLKKGKGSAAPFKTAFEKAARLPFEQPVERKRKPTLGERLRSWGRHLGTGSAVAGGLGLAGGTGLLAADTAFDPERMANMNWFSSIADSSAGYQQNMMDYAQRGSGAMSQKAWGWLPMFHVMKGSRSIPGIPKDLRWNYLDDPHYGSFSESEGGGPFRAAGQLARETSGEGNWGRGWWSAPDVEAVAKLVRERPADTITPHDIYDAIGREGNQSVTNAIAAGEFSPDAMSEEGRGPENIGVVRSFHDLIQKTLVSPQREAQAKLDAVRDAKLRAAAEAHKAQISMGGREPSGAPSAQVSVGPAPLTPDEALKLPREIAPTPPVPSLSSLDYGHDLNRRMAEFAFEKGFEPGKTIPAFEQIRLLHTFDPWLQNKDFELWRQKQWMDHVVGEGVIGSVQGYNKNMIGPYKKLQEFAGKWGLPILGGSAALLGGGLLLRHLLRKRRQRALAKPAADILAAAQAVAA